MLPREHQLVGLLPTKRQPHGSGGGGHERRSPEHPAQRLGVGALRDGRGGRAVDRAPEAVGDQAVVDGVDEVVEVDPRHHLPAAADGSSSAGAEERQAAELSVARAEERLGRSVHTAVEEVGAFWQAEDYHQKYRLRRHAKLTEELTRRFGSDRGMVDIERFDLEPNRPLLHGLIQGVAASSLEGLSDKERIPFALRVLGVDDMSVELAASLVEVGETITGWPQLASAVAVGGGLVSDLARKILLGTHNASGRFYVDLDELFQPDRAAISLLDAPSVPASTPPVDPPPVAPLTGGKGAVSESEVRALVAVAIRAPSGGNNQGWKFSFDGTTLLCRIDPARVQTFLEFDRTGSSVSLGAAVENLAVAASAAGIAVEEEMMSTSSDPDLLCSVRFRRDASCPEDPLARWIEHRRTSRARGNGKRLRPEHASALDRSIATSDATLQLLSSDEELEEIADIMGNNDRLAFQHEEVHAELMGDIRWTQDELHRRRDGLDLQTFDMKPHEISALGVLARWPVMDRLREGNLGMGLESATRRAVQASAAVGLLSVPGSSSHAYFAGGRAMQRMWLEVTRLGIAMQPMTVLPALLTRLLRGQGQGFSQWHRAHLSALAVRYGRLYQRPVDHSDIMLFRLAYAPLETRPSLRRDLTDVYEYTGS